MYCSHDALQIVKLAESAFAAATELVRARSTDVSNEGGSAKATPWLLWSLELLEGTKGEAFKAMQVSHRRIRRWTSLTRGSEGQRSRSSCSSSS